MRAIKLLTGAGAAVLALALAACGGGSGGSSQLAPTAATPATGPLSITVTRSAAGTSSTARTPEFIPASAQSVTMVVYTGTLALPAANAAFQAPPGATPFSTVCQNFPVGATTLALSSTAPVGADTIVITSYTVPCSGSLVAANVASQFSGNGTVTAAGGTVASIFNGGNPVTLLPAAAASGTVLISVTSGAGTTTPSATPTAVTFAATGEIRTVAVTETNYAGTFTATTSNATVATVSPASGTSFTVTSTGGGTATITFTDSAAQSSTLTVGSALGSVIAGYSTTFGASSAPVAAPAAIAFPAATLTASITPVSQVGYAGLFTASSSCAAVTVAPTTPSAGPFTVTAVSTATTGCTISIQGKTGTAPLTIAATVTAPSNSVQLRWIPPQGLAPGVLPPVASSSAPINLVLSNVATTLIVTELNYLGGFSATPTLTGCTGLTATAIAAPNPIPAGLTLQPGQGVQFYSLVATAAIASGVCTITVKDNQTPANVSASAPVVSTVVSGVFQ